MNNCNQSGAPVIKCKVNTRAKFWILSCERELYRPSNTARLLKLVNPTSTEIFLWERTKKPDQLIRNINMDKYETFVLFPIENQEFDDDNKVLTNKAKDNDRKFEITSKIPAFIILDGTWKEARKIFRRSDFLKDLPNITLKPLCSSKYDLRRGATPGNLCTIEAAIEILRMNHENEKAGVIEDCFNLFLNSYKAGVSDHLFRT